MFTEIDRARLNGLAVVSIIDLLERCEAYGYWEYAEYLLNGSTVQSMETYASIYARSVLADFRQKLNLALAYEHIHGAGSLFDASNPKAVRFRLAIKPILAKATSDTGRKASWTERLKAVASSALRVVERPRPLLKAAPLPH